MKSFIKYITELEQDWQYMKKPEKKFTAVDDYGRTIDTTKANRTANSAVRELPQTGSIQPDPPSYLQKKIRKLADSPAGTEGRAEYNLRKQHSQPGSINMLPRMTGPETDPEKEQYDTYTPKKTTQDPMPEIQTINKKRNRM
jgi:hypothetical protein